MATGLILWIYLLIMSFTVGTGSLTLIGRIYAVIRD